MNNVLEHFKHCRTFLIKDSHHSIEDTLLHLTKYGKKIAWVGVLNYLHALGILIGKPLPVMLLVITMSLIDTFSLIKDRKWGNIYSYLIWIEIYVMNIFGKLCQNTWYRKESLMYKTVNMSSWCSLTYTNHFFFFFFLLCIFKLEISRAKTFFPTALGSSHKAYKMPGHCSSLRPEDTHKIKHDLFRNKNSETI